VGTLNPVSFNSRRTILAGCRFSDRSSDLFLVRQQAYPPDMVLLQRAIQRGWLFSTKSSRSRLDRHVQNKPPSSSTLIQADPPTGGKIDPQLVAQRFAGIRGAKPAM